MRDEALSPLHPVDLDLSPHSQKANPSLVPAQRVTDGVGIVVTFISSDPFRLRTVSYSCRCATLMHDMLAPYAPRWFPRPRNPVN